MKYILRLVCMALLLIVVGCTDGVRLSQIAPASQPVNLLPMYGEAEGIVKTPAMRAADEAFITTVLAGGDTRDSGAVKSAKAGWVAFGKGDRDTAMRRFNQSWLLDPESAEAFHGFAVILADQAAPEAKVIPMFQKSLAGHHVQPSAYNDYGVYLNRLGKYTEALPLLEKAVAIDPDYASFRSELMVTLLRLKRIAEFCSLAKNSQARGFPVPPETPEACP